MAFFTNQFSYSEGLPVPSLLDTSNVDNESESDTECINEAQRDFPAENQCIKY
jgi:hypothetical protein